MIDEYGTKISFLNNLLSEVQSLADLKYTKK